MLFIHSGSLYDLWGIKIDNSVLQCPLKNYLKFFWGKCEKVGQKWPKIRTSFMDIRSPKKSGLLMACCPKAHLTMLLGKIYLSCNEACLQSHTYGVSGFFFRNFYTFLRNRKEVKIVLTLHLIEFLQTLFHKIYWSSQFWKDAELQNFSNLMNRHFNLDPDFYKSWSISNPRKISGSANIPQKS